MRLNFRSLGKESLQGNLLNEHSPSAAFLVLVIVLTSSVSCRVRRIDGSGAVTMITCK